MSATSIEWTDVTWNPVRGCTRVSEGCRNCYAERQAVRFPWGRPYAKRTAAGPRWTGRVELVPSKLREPLSWRQPRRVFVNSMSDLFHESLSFADVERVFDVMLQAERHTFQVLTKRPARMLKFVRDRWLASGSDLPSNVWLGVSVEDQETADHRIALLVETPAARRFVSYEPALGPITFRWARWSQRPKNADGSWATWNHLDGLRELDWVIVGGESGPGARPFDPAWARTVVGECREAGVACFVKQLGARIVANAFDSFPETTLPARWDWVDRWFIPPIIGGAERMRAKPEGAETFGLCDRKGGDPTEWPEDLRVREFPA